MNTTKITDVKIIGTIAYMGRVLGLIEFIVDGKIHRSHFYRSSGTNVDGKGTWFPCSGLAGPGALKGTFMHNGWIIKDNIYSTEGILDIQSTVISSERDHANPIIRRDNSSFICKNGNIPYSIMELSEAVGEIYTDSDATHLTSIQEKIDPNDIAFINTWILKGLMHAKSPIDLEAIEEKRLKGLAIMAMMDL